MMELHWASIAQLGQRSAALALFVLRTLRGGFLASFLLNDWIDNEEPADPEHPALPEDYTGRRRATLITGEPQRRARMSATLCSWIATATNAAGLASIVSNKTN